MLDILKNYLKLYCHVYRFSLDYTEGESLGEHDRSVFILFYERKLTGQFAVKCDASTSNWKKAGKDGGLRVWKIFEKDLYIVYISNCFLQSDDSTTSLIKLWAWRYVYDFYFLYKE